jgi:hypothetical protein
MILESTDLTAVTDRQIAIDAVVCYRLAIAIANVDVYHDEYCCDDALADFSIDDDRHVLMTVDSMTDFLIEIVDALAMMICCSTIRTRLTTKQRLMLLLNRSMVIYRLFLK